MLEYFQGNKDWLLSNIDQLRIWSNILGYSVNLGDKILNPLRSDKHLGSCFLKQYGSNIIMIDFADKNTSGFDCVSAYKRLYPYKKWGELCSDLLGMGQIAPTSSYRVIPGIKQKQETELTPIYKNWSISDLEWWDLRGVKPDQLDRDITLTKPVKGYIQIKANKTSEIHFGEQCYCYHCDTKVKFYWPNRKNYRFLGNAGKNDLWYLNRGSDTLLISKSHKDLLVWENLIPFDLTHVQSETNYPDKDKFFEWECYYKQIIICMDNDETGRSISQEIKKQFLYTPVQIIEIESSTGCKDIDEFYLDNGFRETLDYVNYLL